MCLGCPTLLPLNHTGGLDFVQASLSKLNNVTENVTYTIMEVGRMSSQVGQRNVDVVALHASISTSHIHISLF